MTLPKPALVLEVKTTVSKKRSSTSKATPLPKVVVTRAKKVAKPVPKKLVVEKNEPRTTAETLKRKRQVKADAPLGTGTSKEVSVVTAEKFWQTLSGHTPVVSEKVQTETNPTRRRFKVLKPSFETSGLRSTFLQNSKLIGSGLALFGVTFAAVFGFNLISIHSQTAELAAITAGSTTLIASSTTELHCVNGQVKLLSACVNPEPPITLTILSNHDQLKGLVTIQGTVEYADRVKLLLYSRDTHVSIPLGPMIKTGDTSFTFNWPTDLQHDGIYFLQTLIENQFGAYETADTAQQLTVQNHPLAASAISTTTIESTASTSTKSSTSTTFLIVNPTISSDVTESNAEFKLTITATSAQSVKLFARELATNLVRTLGYAYQDSDSLWRFRWITGDTPLGQYAVSGQVVLINTTTRNTPQITVKKVAIVSTSTTATTTPVIKKVLVPDPTVTALISPNAPVHGLVDLKVQVANASSVELYALGVTTLNKKYLGRATNVDDGVWLLHVDSNSIPDGDYTLITFIKNVYGSYENRPLHFVVKNRKEPVLTPEQTAKVAALRDTAAALPTDAIDSVQPIVKSQAGTTTPPMKSVKVATDTVTSIKEQTSINIHDELAKLALALRKGDAVQVSAIKANIEALKKQAITRTLGTEVTSNEVSSQIDTFVGQAIARTESNVVTIDKIITDRTGDKASLDTDHDGIPDFDEVTIYKTNPYLADTDNDGFLDGAEILKGYDPLSAKAEALVAYDSPQDAGVAEPELLAVTSVITATTSIAGDPVITDTTNPIAIISGKAPANSFVTLYIFSTPVVITIKTDADGGWNYHFDKELENGTHQVYVGVTDNAGKIVAKSAPFSFVKTAEAYSGQKEATDAVVTPTPSVQRNLLSSNVVYVIFGLFLALIGFVTLFLGAQIDARRHETNVLTT